WPACGSLSPVRAICPRSESLTLSHNNMLALRRSWRQWLYRVQAWCLGLREAKRRRTSISNARSGVSRSLFRRAVPAVLATPRSGDIAQKLGLKSGNCQADQERRRRQPAGVSRWPPARPEDFEVGTDEDRRPRRWTH
uniref:Integron gene cassette protein n=1 Tax=Macrostomum lignano TaxID=282301 RepID=A0A1I8F9W5_9PLAT